MPSSPNAAPGEPESGTGRPLQHGRVYINAGDESTPAASRSGRGTRCRQRPEPREPAQGQYFDRVPPEVWEFHIGGYQVAEKWLKDRRERSLANDDIMHYQRVVTALWHTIRIMKEIDEAIPSWPMK